ncbi:acetylxylan esterase [uncultured Gimesia sp.]|uniref:alpha/beta hydrolase n=1 Tax=uncultured Gimesia sp. TaxID=1678688 RepID=UPI0030D7F268|tara:strand:+ start:83332 stop:84627 length:1296 start_codon:yes stop_codon:yes gene_type:complete
MKRLLLTAALVFNIFLICSQTSQAQRPKPNYDEAKIPKFSLPDPLVTADGKKVDSPELWWKVRRPEILRLFESEVYGKSPAPPKDLLFEVTSQKNDALNGKAIRKEVSVYFSGKKEEPRMDLLIYLPAKATKQVPVFMALNFYGNHTIANDPEITLSTKWMRANKDKGIVDHRATEKSRGASASRWAIDQILDRGYGLVAIYCGDIDPDFDDGFQNGVHPLFNKPGQTKPAADEWGTIAAWSWGLSRAMDYLETDNQIDHKQVAVMGHSRLGKTSLWAGAQDPRFALVISNDSGCGGAALSRRRIGETLNVINNAFPHWFCDNFNKYIDKEDELPVDQHMLISLIAPRPVYVASAEDDRWADPKGEFLSVKYAEPVYKLLGTSGFGAKEMPKVNQPIQQQMGYHIRTGKHDVTDFDWQQYLDFADQHFKGS